jgi:multidrug efflux pump subunit AcrB
MSKIVASRRNVYRAAILGAPAPTSSTGTAMATMERLISQLPEGIGYEWTGQSYEEQKSGSQTGPLYAISLTVILLCLAALYESWPIPISVLLVVPLGVSGAIIATSARGLRLLSRNACLRADGRLSARSGHGCSAP